MGYRTTAALVTFLLAWPMAGSGQRLLERTPNLPNSVTVLPGMLEAALPHRFANFAGAEGLSTATTFDLAVGWPWLMPVHWTSGVRFAPSSHIVAGETDEWEGYDRFGLLRQARGDAVDLTVTGAYNLAAHSVDGAGVQAGLPYTPLVFGVQASNTNTTTIEGASLGTSRTRYGFELNAPVELIGFVLGWFTPRERALEAVTEDVNTAATVRVRILGYLFTPATIRIRAGETVEWVNEDDVVHTVNAENAAFESGAIQTGETWRARFDRPGRYPYYCGPHPFMKGVVIVVAR